MLRSLRAVEGLYGIFNGNPTIDANQYQKIGGEVETKHLHQFHQFAGELVCNPLYGIVPDSLADDTKPGYKNVGDGQMKDQDVHGTAAVRLMSVLSKFAYIPDGE